MIFPARTCRRQGARRGAEAGRDLVELEVHDLGRQRDRIGAARAAEKKKVVVAGEGVLPRLVERVGLKSASLEVQIEPPVERQRVGQKRELERVRPRVAARTDRRCRRRCRRDRRRGGGDRRGRRRIRDRLAGGCSRIGRGGRRRLCVDRRTGFDPGQGRATARAALRPDDPATVRRAGRLGHQRAGRRRATRRERPGSDEVRTELTGQQITCQSRHRALRVARPARSDQLGVQSLRGGGRRRCGGGRRRNRRGRRRRGRLGRRRFRGRWRILRLGGRRQLFRAPPASPARRRGPPGVSPVCGRRRRWRRRRDVGGRSEDGAAADPLQESAVGLAAGGERRAATVRDAGCLGQQEAAPRAARIDETPDRRMVALDVAGEDQPGRGGRTARDVAGPARRQQHTVNAPRERHRRRRNRRGRRGRSGGRGRRFDRGRRVG